jgi:hypothetical protein
MISPVWFIMQNLLVLLFAPSIGPTDQIRRPIGHQRNFVVLKGVTVSGTTSPFFKPASTDNGLTASKDKYWLLLKTLYGFHWSPLHFDFSHDSSSDGTLGCVVKRSFCTKLLFCGYVFLSHMPDHLSPFSSVEHGLSAYTTPSSRFHQACSAIRYFLRKDGFLQVSFPHHECIEFTLVGGFSCFIVYGRKDGGCCSTCVP